ncbi:MAG: hypothetical protein CTY37_00225 [Methylotenera sp.]|nr:MAG: hypothetical protein CTY37_00225 [Methylotenera sp.]PPD19054.1 MAG: hypothetical protein CTY27_00070 [Methylotenera sp.]
MIKLPEKSFFTIPQLAQRWNVDESEINHLIDTNQLPIADKYAALKGKNRTVFVAQDPHLSDEEQNIWLQEQLALHEENNEEVVFIPISDELVPFWNEVMLRAESNYPDSKVQVVLLEIVEQFESLNGATELKKHRTQQHEIIVATIKGFGYEQQNIPYGGKAKVKKICISDYPRYFTDASFDHAWNAGLDMKLFRTEKHQLYAKGK